MSDKYNNFADFYPFKQSGTSKEQSGTSILF